MTYHSSIWQQGEKNIIAVQFKKTFPLYKNPQIPTATKMLLFKRTSSKHRLLREPVSTSKHREMKGENTAALPLVRGVGRGMFWTQWLGLEIHFPQKHCFKGKLGISTLLDLGQLYYQPKKLLKAPLSLHSHLFKTGLETPLSTLILFFSWIKFTKSCLILQSFVCMVVSPFDFKFLAGKRLVFSLLYPWFLICSEKREQIKEHLFI